MKKRIPILIIFLIVAFCLTACDNGNNNGNGITPEYRFIESESIRADYVIFTPDKVAMQKCAGPTITIVSNVKIKSAEIYGYGVKPNENSKFDIELRIRDVIRSLNKFEEYKNRYIYTFETVAEVINDIGVYGENNTAVIQDIRFVADEHDFDIIIPEYEIGVYFCDEIDIEQASAFISNAAEGYATQSQVFKANQDVTVTDIELSGKAMELLNNNNPFDNLPINVSKGQSVSYSLTLAGKNREFGYCSDYFVITYKRAGESELRKIPVKSFALQKGTTPAKIYIDNLVK